MGTNYYLRYNQCTCCDRYDELHIGKSSGGWSFSFHAIEEYISMKDIDPKHLLAGSDDKLLVIHSYKDWKKFINRYVLELETAKIYDEYGTLIHPSELYEMIERKKGEKNHTTYVKENHPDSAYRDFYDEEGNSFSTSEFT